MLRLAAAILLVVLVAVPVAVLPAAPVSWLAVGALAVAGAGIAMLSVSVVTAGATLALITYALALVIAQPPVDPVAAIAVGVDAVGLLALVQFAGHAQGALLGPAVLAGRIRQLLLGSGLGAAVSVALIAVATVLGFVLRDATLPVVVAAAALGALLAMAGLVALVTAGSAPPSRA
jgi:hypothetical protein